MLILANVTAASSLGSRDGSVQATVSNATAPFHYLWSNSTTASLLDKVPAGLYTVTVTDSTLPIPIVAIATFTVSQISHWSADHRPYAVSYLSDNACRDAYSRFSYSQGIFQQQDGSDQRILSSVISSISPQGTPALSLSVLDNSSSTLQEVANFSTAGLVVHGDLTVTGSATKVDVAAIRVIDKTILLADGVQTATGIDGAGMLLGSDGAAFQRSWLYNQSRDTMIGNFTAQFTNGLTIVDSVASTLSSLGPTTFSVHNANGAGITLDSSGLRLTNAQIYSQVSTVTYALTESGLVYSAQNSTAIGWSPNQNTWGTTAPFVAPMFTAGNTSFSTTGMIVQDVSGSVASSLSSSGLNLGPGRVALTQAGLDINAIDGVIYFGSRIWRISYNQTDESLEFDKLVNGVYVSKLVLD